eukprot:TRINITY_DN4137_c0_g1_i10.p1 TRINITY_DN4137_c0_g1~~TRINITY_DN4137_c0_g1_i10.p1  ORF type:complete len:180 (+),score=27.21 TRINITY_DN4137_c0_g1_i10:344-883(+)
MSELLGKSLDDYISETRLAGRSRHIRRREDGDRPSGDYRGQERGGGYNRRGYAPRGRYKKFRGSGRGEDSRGQRRRRSQDEGEPEHPEEKEGDVGERSPRARSRGNNGCRLIVKHVKNSVTTEDLKELFSLIGKVKFCKILPDKFGTKAPNYAIVEYEDGKDAEKAIKEYNGKSYLSSF